MGNVREKFMADYQKHSDISTAPALVALAEAEAQKFLSFNRATERVEPEARWVVAEGADAAAMSRSIPLTKAMDDALVCLYQNGERVRPSNGGAGQNTNEDCGKFLALCDNTIRLCPSRNAIPRVEIAHCGRALRCIGLYPQSQRDRRVERCARCAVAAEGENAEPGRVHPVPAQYEVASAPDLGPLLAHRDI
jgi:hypothetical protein